MNHKKVKRLMNEQGLFPATYKRARYSSYKGEIGKTAPNILHRQFDVDAPDKVWATDVTEFQTDEGKLYLSPIKDLCTREIISYDISTSPNMPMVMKMLDTALQNHPDHKGLMIHSDQGFQYQHTMFVNRLKKEGIIQSMSRKGNCLDNSKMETFFSTLKKEKRIQMKLGYLPPLIFREKIA